MTASWQIAGLIWLPLSFIVAIAVGKWLAHRDRWMR